MSTSIPEQCQACKHFHAKKRGNYCNAYPDTPIPREILEMRVDHRSPHPGDQGIRWEPIEPGTRHPMDEEGK